MLIETMQVDSMEEASEHVAEAASVLGWDSAEATIMDAAQEVLYLQGAEESMLATMALEDVWAGVLEAVHGILVCATEAERAAEALREADRAPCRGSEAAVDASADVQFLEALSIWSHHIDETERLPAEIAHTHEAAAAEQAAEEPTEAASTTEQATEGPTEAANKAKQAAEEPPEAAS